METREKCIVLKSRTETGYVIKIVPVNTRPNQWFKVTSPQVVDLVGVWQESQSNTKPTDKPDDPTDK